jgi:hypothetical protein
MEADMQHKLPQSLRPTIWIADLFQVHDTVLQDETISYASGADPDVTQVSLDFIDNSFPQADPSDKECKALLAPQGKLHHLEVEATNGISLSSKTFSELLSVCSLSAMGRFNQPNHLLLTSNCQGSASGWMYLHSYTRH